MTSINLALENPSQRLKFITQKLNKKAYEISTELGFSPTYLSKMINGEREISREVLDKLYNTYGISTDYLLHGKGEIFSDVEGSEVLAKVEEKRGPYVIKKDQLIPFYDIDITAGNMPLFQDNEAEPVQYYSMPSFADCTAIFPIYGESMNPRYKPGDRVIVKEYPHFTDYIRFGEVYLIFTTNEERMIKIIRKSEKSGYVKLSSVNPDYDDFEIPVAIITKMFLVRGKFSIENQ